MKKKKHNPTDATMRNVRAVNKKIKDIMVRLRFHMELIEKCEFQIESLIHCLAHGVDRQKFMDIKEKRGKK